MLVLLGWKGFVGVVVLGFICSGFLVMPKLSTAGLKTSVSLAFVDPVIENIQNDLQVVHLKIS